MFIYVSEDTYQDGHVLLKEGTSGNWLYVVLSGAVEISKTIEGKKYVIDVLRPGEVFGEVGFIGGKKRTATATTVGQTVVGVVDLSSLDAEFNRLSSDFRGFSWPWRTDLKRWSTGLWSSHPGPTRGYRRRSL